FDVKGAVELLCRALGAAIRFETATAPFLVPGQTPAIVAGSTAVGLAGLLSPAIAEKSGTPRQDRVFVAELNLDRLRQLAALDSEWVRELPRHPLVVRDLSIVVSESLPAEIIHGTIRTAGDGQAAPLTAIAFFDRYQGKGVPEGSVSLS